MGEPGRAPRYQKPAPGEPRPKAPELQFLDQQNQSHPVCPERPARVQVTQIRPMQQAEHLGEYNIWYGRDSGERAYEKNGKASTRCSIELGVRCDGHGMRRVQSLCPARSVFLVFRAQ